MASSRSPTISDVIGVAKLINRWTTPDRSSSIREAQRNLEQAQRNLKTAKDPSRARDAADSAKDALAIAEEKLAKATTAFNLASEKLRQAQESQPTSEQIQILEAELQTADDRASRASRKVERLQESVKLISDRLKRSQQLEKPIDEIQGIETELEAEQSKLSRATIQLNAKKAKFKQASDALKQAQSAFKSPEQLQVLIDRVNEAQGNLDRATQKVEAARTNHQAALTDVQTIESEYLRLESELAIATSEFTRISEETEREKRFRQIEKSLEQVEQGAQFAGEVRTAIDPFLNAEWWWNAACLGSVAFVALVYFTPIAIVLQRVTKTVQWTIEKVDETKQYIDSTFAPDLKDVPKVGETIAGWEVTSGFGPRTAPCASCSSDHGGIDLADPRGAKYTMGRELYGIGKPGTKLELTCWEDSGGGGLVATLKPKSLPDYTIEYLHLSKCLLDNNQTKTINAGTVIAKVGDSGAGTAPHLHLQVKDKSGKKIPPPRAIAWWALTGEEPQPVVAQRRLKP